MKPRYCILLSRTVSPESAPPEKAQAVEEAQAIRQHTATNDIIAFIPDIRSLTAVVIALDEFRLKPWILRYPLPQVAIAIIAQLLQYAVYHQR